VETEILARIQATLTINCIHALF